MEARGGFGSGSPYAASVVLSTFNQPALLERALLGYARQSRGDFEIIVADDGSGEETLHLLQKMQSLLPVPLAHVWQPDEGFRKARIVNRAALCARSAYLIFSDGDCIPGQRFVADHLDAGCKGQYVVGGHIRLSEQQTGALTTGDVERGRFESWPSPLQRAELWWTHGKSLVYIALGKRRKPKLYGMNFSVDRASFERVNGFDMTFQNCGREDSDLRNRMQIAGIRARSLWHRARVFHQSHPPNLTRLGWAEAPAYYNRPHLAPEAPQGLRELGRTAEVLAPPGM